MPNIFLIGPMASGKTIVGQLLAALLKKQFIDSDDIICRVAGMNIATIFARENETGFRNRETQALVELTNKKNIVLATGGGTVLTRKNRELLKKNGTVVFLNTSVEQQLARLKKDKTPRPLLNNSDNLQTTLETIRTERLPLYRETADFTISSDTGTPRQIAEAIVRLIKIAC